MYIAIFLLITYLSCFIHMLQKISLANFQDLVCHTHDKSRQNESPFEAFHSGIHSVYYCCFLPSSITCMQHQAPCTTHIAWKSPNLFRNFDFLDNLFQSYSVEAIFWCLLRFEAATAAAFCLLVSLVCSTRPPVQRTLHGSLQICSESLIFWASYSNHILSKPSSGAF